MKIATKQEWTKRLRSGEQGTEYLNKDGKFCCLGVLAEILVDRGDLTRELIDGKFIYFDSEKEYRGLLAECKDTPPTEHQLVLANLNDD